MTRRTGDMALPRLFRSPILPSLLIFCILIISCGKKGEPTLKSYEKPDAPSDLRAIHRESEILLFWDFPAGEELTIKGFQLMKSIPSSPSLGKGSWGDFEKVAFFEPDKRSYTDTDFKIGSQYRYKIVSENLRGVLSNDSNIIEIIPEEPPLPPENISFKIEFNSITLTWGSTGDEILYNIYKSNKKGIYSLTPLNKEPVKETSFKDSFDVEKTAYYTIRSLRGGVIRNEGPASGELEVNPSDFVPSAPEGLQAVVQDDKVYLIWKEVPETWVTGYRVYREIDKSAGYLFIGETTIPAFVDNEKPLTKRNYKVTALGPSKEGSASEINDVVFVPYR
jgi:hypothetical protein